MFISKTLYSNQKFQLREDSCNKCTPKCVFKEIKFIVYFSFSVDFSRATTILQFVLLFVLFVAIINTYVYVDNIVVATNSPALRYRLLLMYMHLKYSCCYLL